MGKQIISYLEYENAIGQIGIIGIQVDGCAIVSIEMEPDKQFRNFALAERFIVNAGYQKINNF